MADKNIIPLLSVGYDEDADSLVFECENKETAILYISQGIIEEMIDDNNTPVSFLFSLVLHLMAQDRSETIERDFQKNLKKFLPIYRSEYDRLSTAANITMKEEQ